MLFTFGVPCWTRRIYRVMAQQLKAFRVSPPMHPGTQDQYQWTGDWNVVVLNKLIEILASTCGHGLMGKAETVLLVDRHNTESQPVIII